MMPMGRPDNCCYRHQDRLWQREATELPASDGHSVPVCDRNGSTIATSQMLDRVVLVPCSASSARQWKALSEQLPGFHSLPLDLWGHGSHGRWHGARPFSLSEEAATIYEACPDGTPFHLIGHSYGGGVALRFALSHPQRLRSLTLIELSSFHVLKDAQGTDAHLLTEIRAVADAVNRGVICGDYVSGMQTFIDYWVGAGSWESLSDDKKVQFGYLAVHIAHHFWSLIRRENVTGGLHGHRCANADSVWHAFPGAIARHNSTPCGDPASCAAPHDPWCRSHVADHTPSRSERAHSGARAEEPTSGGDHCGRQPAYWRAPPRVRGG